MPRLLRVHFASIGHPDARLAPVTLDFTNGGGGQHVPAGNDTVIWLRNGGGKSSMLNLLFSVFLPDMREFLGTTAEGKKQRFDDYVQANDLGFVITQWDLSETDTRPLFDDLPAPSRIVGRMVAWPDQHKSMDASKLKRLFFSLKTAPDIQLRSLPVQGLGEPIRSFEDFRRWLFDLREAKPELDVYYTEVQREWREHLSSIHLDPELFRYLVQMNRNEGDAESLFRHKTARDFVRFFLEMTLDPSRAASVINNMQELKKQLRARPKRLLESRFLEAVVAQFEPLTAEVARYRDAATRLNRLCFDGSALIAGLTHSRDTLEEESRREEARAQSAAKQRREHEQAEIQFRRQAAWLQRRAAKLELAEAEAAFSEAQAGQQHAKDLVCIVEAAKCLARVRELEAQKKGLIEAQRMSERGRAPLRQAAEAAGTRLVALLDDAVATTRERQRGVSGHLTKAEETRGQLSDELGRLQTEIGQLAERAANLGKQITRRDQAAATLVADGILDSDETSAEALNRWKQQGEISGRQLQSAQNDHTESERAIERLQEELDTLIERCNTVDQDRRTQELELERAVAGRDELSAHPRIVEVEEVERANLEAPGLKARLAESLHATQNRLFRLRIEAVEGKRALDSIQRTQLLPPPPDVEIVVRELQARDIPAGPFLAYLAEHLSPDDAERLLASNPGRFTGVGVPTANWLEKVRELDESMPGIHGPVQVSLFTLDNDEEPAAGLVLTPGERGAFCHSAAQSVRHRLEAEELDRAERRERLDCLCAEIGDVIRKLNEFLDLYGDGRLAKLESVVNALREEATELRGQIEATRKKLGEAKERRSELTAKTDEFRQAVQTAASHTQRINIFIAEHEEELPRVGEELKETRRRQSELDTKRRSAKSQLAKVDQKSAEYRAEIHQYEIELRDLGKEKDVVRYQTDGAEEAAAVSLEEARAEYAELERSLDRELSNDRTQGQLDQLEPDLTQATEDYRLAVNELSVDDVEACCDAGHLDIAMTKAKRNASDLAEQRGKAEVSRDNAAKALQEVEGSTDSRIAPPNAASVDTATKARERAAELLVECATQTDKKEQTERNRRDHEVKAAKAKSRADDRRSHEKLLRVLVKEPVDAEPASLPADAAELELAITEFCDQFEEAQRLEQDLNQAVHGRLARIRATIDNPEFADHQDQIRARLRADESVMIDQAETMLQRLQERLHVTADLLKTLDEHRTTVLTAVHELAMDAKRLLGNIEKVSVMPDGFDAWTGKPFLRVRLPAIGKTPDERMARLEPLVDRIMEEAELPDGVRLAAQALEALLGGRDFDVTLLKPKPKGARQANRHSIAQLASFSEGEKLTVAVLLFCTLIRLRARNRPSDQGGAKVLVLDNPFGKCNYPEFIRQQLAIANQLNIQLVYTTGVEDLGALSHFPNRIKLRNTTRNRRTGFAHVTHDEEGIVTGIRVARREAANDAT